MKPCAQDSECIPNCIDSTPDCTCVCSHGSSDVQISASDEPGFNILYIVVPVVIIVVLGLVIALAVIVHIARNKRATRGIYSPNAQEFYNPRVELGHVLKPPPEERLI